jgi:hypothetical protein
MSNELVTVENPFSSNQVDRAEAGAVNAIQRQEQERAIAETKAAIMLAKQFPRDQADATNRILMACCRPTLAEKAVYSYPKGGQEVSGPSIRLAEAIAQAWGNLQFGIRELDQRDGVSTVEAFAWDVETNTRQTKVFQVSHKRHTKKGDYMITDPREIYEMVANQGARRMRNCILGLVPGDVVEAAVDQAEKTLATKIEVTPERIAKMLGTFEAMGVSKEAIKKKIGRNVDETIPPAVFSNLGKIANSIRDGYAKASEHFEITADDGAKSYSQVDAETPDKAALLFDELEVGLTACPDEDAVQEYLKENNKSIVALSKCGGEWAKKWAAAVSKQRAKS